MARISTYPIDSTPTVEDYLIGTEVDNLDVTKNYRISDILALGNSGTVVTATDTTLGVSKLASDVEQLKATATISTVSDRTYGIQHNATDQMVVNVPWVDTANTLTTNGTSGAATLTSGVLNVPNYIPYERVFMELNIHDNTLNPEIQVHYNTTGATFTVATNAAGLYVITASSGIFNASTKTHFSVMNPNILPPLSGTGELPMQTIARVKTTTEFGVDCYRANSGTDSGVATNLPTTGFSVTIEFRIYNISI
jgi:hypothetical protein|tara:strand:+ start:398 stop:1156 length:759 start_codon:yes stop_codon:yes gene_type:complete